MFIKKLNKKADMTISVLIKIIIALVVLAIMIALVWNYAMRAGNNMNNTKEGSIEEITQGKCEIPGLGRKCCDAEYTAPISDKTGYSDCSANEKCCTKKS